MEDKYANQFLGTITFVDEFSGYIKAANDNGIEFLVLPSDISGCPQEGFRIILDKTYSYGRGFGARVGVVLAD